MLTWLQADLESTTQDWIIALWHHPPYTKGSHNSDTETELIEMRQNVLPILEAGGVDLVLTGHSHCYETLVFPQWPLRTFFQFQQFMKIDGGSGREWDRKLR
jgi:3',5'-cyclic AMP phosphodiesterase CpdA